MSKMSSWAKSVFLRSKKLRKSSITDYWDRRGRNGGVFQLTRDISELERSRRYNHVTRFVLGWVAWFQMTLIIVPILCLILFLVHLITGDLFSSWATQFSGLLSSGWFGAAFLFIIFVAAPYLIGSLLDDCNWREHDELIIFLRKELSQAESRQSAWREKTFEERLEKSIRNLRKRN